MPGRMACRQLGPGVLSPHQCWLNPGGVLGGTLPRMIANSPSPSWPATALPCCFSNGWPPSQLQDWMCSWCFSVSHGITIALVMVTVAYCAPRRSQVRLCIPCLSFVSLPLTRYATARCLCWLVNIRRGFLRSCRHSCHWSLIIEHNGYTSDIASSMARVAVIMAGDLVLVFLDTLSQCTNHRAETISKATS